MRPLPLATLSAEILESLRPLLQLRSNRAASLLRAAGRLPSIGAVF
jgi:hypothetical protein